MNMILVRDVRKMDLSYANQEKVGQSYTFLETYHIPGSAKKGAIPPTHPYYVIYRDPPHTHTHDRSSISRLTGDEDL